MATARANRATEGGLSSLPLGIDTAPMEAKLVDALPDDAGWQFEPKWDGFRCLAFRAGDEVDLRAKSGKPLARYFPEVVEFVRALKPDRFVLDGELAIPSATPSSFDALQMRLHPAESRIRKLAHETPAILILFDMLGHRTGARPRRPFERAPGGPRGVLRQRPAKATARLSPYTRDRKEAQRWLAKAGGALDGVIAKRLDGPYVSGERAMLKVKRMRTADCVVGGFPLRQPSAAWSARCSSASTTRRAGSTTSASPRTSAPTRSRPDEAARGAGRSPGLHGRRPGRPEPLVDGAHRRMAAAAAGARRRGALRPRQRRSLPPWTRLVRWRPDKAPRQCTFEQMQEEARPARLVARCWRVSGREGGNRARRRAPDEPRQGALPEQGITKRELAEYAIAVADWMLPHVARRPITLVRCPTGRQKKCFYQRHAGSGVPSELSEVEISGLRGVGRLPLHHGREGPRRPRADGRARDPSVERARGPAERPDRVDLRPRSGRGPGVRGRGAGAHEVRARLSRLGLVSFAKTTGGKGLHVVVPIERRHEWPDVKRFARSLAEASRRMRRPAT
jgi:ATP-dependent DNA ligase